MNIIQMITFEEAEQYFDNFFLVFAAIAMIAVGLAALFYLRHAHRFDEEYPALSKGRFHWLIWPAIAANYLFERIFGKRPARFKLSVQSLEKLRAAAVFADTPIVDKPVKTKHDDRLQQQREDAQAEWDRLREKHRQLTEAKILETRVEEKLRLTELCEQTEYEQQQVEQRLQDLEAEAIAQASSVLEKLAALKDREYIGEDEFIVALEAAAGPANFQHCRTEILQHAEKFTRIRDLFTWRSITATLGVSLAANLICVLFIVAFIPDDAPPWELNLLKILSLSYVWFIFFNFLGDLVSVSFTRHVIWRIVSGRCNFLPYLLLDIFGIILGYLVTLLPTLSITIMCLVTGDDLNQYIHTGLLGNAMIPFFLLIFATTNMPALFALSAFFAVFSITIPTASYLFLMFFCYIGYRFYKLYEQSWKNQAGSGKVETALKILVFSGILLLALIGARELAETFLPRIVP